MPVRYDAMRDVMSILWTMTAEELTSVAALLRAQASRDGARRRVDGGVEPLQVIVGHHREHIQQSTKARHLRIVHPPMHENDATGGVHERQ